MLDIETIRAISWVYLGLIGVSMYTNKGSQNHSWLSFSVFLGAFVFHALSYSYEGSGVHWFGMVLTINLITIVLVFFKTKLLTIGQKVKEEEVYITIQDKFIVAIFGLSSLNNIINMVLRARFQYHDYVPMFNILEIGSCFLIVGVLFSTLFSRKKCPG